jgi:hypothetical protein
MSYAAKLNLPSNGIDATHIYDEIQKAGVVLHSEQRECLDVREAKSFCEDVLKDR